MLPTDEGIPPPDDSAIQQGSVMEGASETVAGKGKQKVSSCVCVNVCGVFVCTYVCGCGCGCGCG